MADTMAEEADKKPTDPLVAEASKRVEEAFDLFDHESNKTVDVSDSGSGLQLHTQSSPGERSEVQLQDMIQEVEEDDPTGFIRLEKFLPMMTRVIQERMYEPATEEKLIGAFQVLDVDKKSHLTAEEVKKFMMEEGEPFTQEEMDEMVSAAIDADKKVLFYRDFVTSLLPEQGQS